MPAVVPFLPAIIGGATSLIGGALSNKNKQQSSTTPTMDPAYSPLQQQILNMTRHRLNSSADLTGYTQAGEGTINRTFNAIGQAQSNNLSARGLGTSPVAGAVDATRENARGSQMAQFINSVPLLQRDMQGQDLAQAQGLLGMGRGSSTTGTGQSGGGAAGGAENLAAYLGYLQGQGKFGKPNPMATPPYAGNNQTSVIGWG